MTGKRRGGTRWFLLVLAAALLSSCGATRRADVVDSGSDNGSPDLPRQVDSLAELVQQDGHVPGKDADSVGDLDAADIRDVLPQDLPPHDLDAGELAGPDASDSETSDMDSNPFPAEPLLCGYQLKEGEYPYNNEYHAQEGLMSSYDPNIKADGVAYYPKRMWLLPDGKTLRVAVLWLNGMGISVGDSEGALLPEHAYSTYCWKPVATVLPSGFVYWDVNTETQEVTFLGETVLAPSDYRGFYYGEPFYRAATQWDPQGSEKWLMEVPVGEDIYQFSACPTFGPHRCRQDIYASNGSMTFEWQGQVLAGHTDPPTTGVQQFFDVILSQREIWSLRRFGPKGDFKEVVPLPVSVHQLSKEKIWRSGCDCEQPIPSVDWSCSEEGPYICGLAKWVDPPYEYCRCSGGGKLAEMPPPEEQIERPYDRAYFTPYEGENGLFSVVHIQSSLHWQQFSNVAGPQCQEDGEGTSNSWPALNGADQMISLGPVSASSPFQFPELCAQYVTAYAPISTPPLTTSYLGCYNVPNSLCGGAVTCDEVYDIEWSFGGLLNFVLSIQVEAPETYPDPAVFIATFGIDPRVPCDLQASYSVPLWDW